MNARRNARRLVALAVVMTLSVVGMAGVVSAKPHKHHHPAGGASGTGGTGTAPVIVVTASPNPLVETGQSEVRAVVQVETSPSFAGDDVTLSSTQFVASCSGPATFNTVQVSQAGAFNIVTIDNDGNATAFLYGSNCAPGSDVIEASMNVAPYDTALTTIQVNPPVVTPAGVTGYPDHEVESGDGLLSVPFGPGPSIPLTSLVYAVFYVETSPVYAEQTVEISDIQLEDSCGAGWVLANPDSSIQVGPFGASPGTEASATLDNDGNAIFYFYGVSCAATTTDVVADVEAGNHPTYVTTFVVDPPTPTI